MRAAGMASLDTKLFIEQQKETLHSACGPPRYCGGAGDLLVPSLHFLLHSHFWGAEDGSTASPALFYSNGVTEPSSLWSNNRLKSAQAMPLPVVLYRRRRVASLSINCVTVMRGNRCF